MEMRPGDTHYVTIINATSGLAVTNFSRAIYRNGVKVELPISMTESPAGFYTFRFTNDGTPGVWCFVVQNSGLQVFNQQWIVRPDLTTPALTRIKNDTERILRNKQRKED